MNLIFVAFLSSILVLVNGDNCVHPSITTVSGREARRGKICPGQLILDENFNYFNPRLWNHERTLGGGGVSCQFVSFLSS